ncbi:hypothetical protein KKB28_01455 [bacterium]|nr:hypothetical protein [bacterium]
MVSEKIDRPPFKVQDCAIITRMGGVSSAVNLRELRERIAMCPAETLYHHFCETLVRPTFDDPEFRNDFAVWASRHLRDRVLAERLGIINPYVFGNIDSLREKVLDIIDERLSEAPYIPWVPKGEEFRFMRGVTIVFDTHAELKTAEDLVNHLPDMSLSAIYYHFVEARRRTPDGTDDFTTWLTDLEEKPEELLQAFAHIDFYFLNLSELKDALVKVAKTIYTAGASKR